MSLRLALVSAFFLLPVPVHAEGRSIIVLDASGSMWGQIDGRPKLEIARGALGEVLAGLDPQAEFGLMAYGHREKGSCEDIELVVPPGPGTAQAITDAAAGMKFLGKTPLTEAVRRAAAELRSTEEKATVILITDGIETCEADPCALGTELESSGVDFTAHVVGFGLTEEEGRTVACLAENTGGKYIEAKDAASLSEALKTTVVVAEPEPEPVPEPEPAPKVVENLDPILQLIAGQEEPPELPDAYFDVFPLAADGTAGERIETIYGGNLAAVEPGRYRVEARLGKASAMQDVEVTTEAVAQPVLVLDAGVVDLSIEVTAGERATEALFEYVTAAGEFVESGYAGGKHVLPAGDYVIRISFGAGKYEEPVTVVAGERQQKTVILGAGVGAVTALYAEGMAVESGDALVEVFPAKKNLDGSRETLTYAYNVAPRFDLPPGDYVLGYKLGETFVETPFSVTAGQQTDVTVFLNAGVAEVTAPGAEYVEFQSAKADLNGNRKAMGYAYGEVFQTTLPAGDYVAVVRRGETTVEAAFAVKAGERTELTVAP